MIGSVWASKVGQENLCECSSVIHSAAALCDLLSMASLSGLAQSDNYNMIYGLLYLSEIMKNHKVDTRCIFITVITRSCTPASARLDDFRGSQRGGETGIDSSH